MACPQRSALAARVRCQPGAVPPRDATARGARTVVRGRRTDDGRVRLHVGQGAARDCCLNLNPSDGLGLDRQR